MSTTMPQRSQTALALDPQGAAHVDAIRRDGFVVVPGLFDEAEIGRISAWTDELEREP